MVAQGVELVVAGRVVGEDLDLRPRHQRRVAEAGIAFEHTWMRPVRDAVVNSGGVLIADVQIPADVVDEVLAAVGQVKSSSDGGRIPHALS